MKETELNNGIAAKVRGIDANGNSIVTTPKEIAKSGGCGTFSMMEAFNGKWYRIAISRRCYMASSVLLNVGSRYTNNAPCSQLFYIALDGYSKLQNVVQLGTAGKCISKVRLLYKGSTTENGMIDIYISANGRNDIDFAYSNNIGFTFQKPIEVPEEPDAGYNVKEFTF
ncbi:hypothetical protein [Bacteroides cellulosilyticus]|uniref:hypothetical protein n=1 Tax=Bacteroides cellulosilyticus TaxID=246787 RepID=UPI0034A39F4F